MEPTLPKHDIVLLGIGHTNAHIVRMWRMKPLADAKLTCISNSPIATYSGMLPGVLAGIYTPEQMQIDLVRLCASVGARLIVDEVTGLDLANKRIRFSERADVGFDVLSIGIGSVPSQLDRIHDASHCVSIKPMVSFLDRLQQHLLSAAEEHDGVLRVAVVGAGAGGTEIAFCLPNQLRKSLPRREFRITLVNGSKQVVNGSSASVQRLARKQMAAHQIDLLVGRVAAVDGRQMTMEDGSQPSFDLILWATGATAPPLLGRLGLKTDDRGFLSIRSTLQTCEHDDIFAVGDTGTLVDSPTPKAGVYAVRQGPILFENLEKRIRRQSLVEYRPQKDFLKLLSTGDGKALGEYARFGFHGTWAWKWKDRIDRKFMAMYQDYQPMPMDSASAVSSPPEMRCAGCGGKVSGSVLSKVLGRLDVPPSEHVLIGLDHPDDAAVIAAPGGRPLTVTADFFSSPLDDPFVLGRIAALNSASDVFAMGAHPIAAVTLASIPVGPAKKQEQLLFEMLAGSLHEFRKMGATLVGGHTIEGPMLTLGFTVLADSRAASPKTKGQLQVGDHLVLTKPLGSGVLLAAHMRALVRASWYTSLMESLLLSNQPAAQLADRHALQGLTDITGFGLAGHLLEMLTASHVSAKIALDKVALLPGVAELIRSGVESTLAPANRSAEAMIQVAYDQTQRPEYQVLFDPQTCGGLLLAVPEAKLESVMRELEALSSLVPADIGQVVAAATETPVLRIE